VYTLIRPIHGSPSGPEIHRVTVRSDVGAEEVTPVFVPGGWWKASEIPETDLALGNEENVGCLISKVVVPGWNVEQHQFIGLDKVSSGGAIARPGPGIPLLSTWLDSTDNAQLKAMWNTQSQHTISSRKIST
jgi:hypothetical protein